MAMTLRRALSKASRHLVQPSATPLRWNAPAKALAVSTRHISYSSKRMAKMVDDGEDEKEVEEEIVDEEELYDPYKQFEQENDGARGYREFNSDNVVMDEVDFLWEEPENMMADKSWPATSGTEMFQDLINVNGDDEELSADKIELVKQEVFRRIGHPQSIADIQLPEMSVDIPEEDPDKEAMEIMKLSLMNNGRINMDDKDEIMQSLLNEMQHLRADKTVLFKGMEEMKKSLKEEEN